MKKNQTERRKAALERLKRMRFTEKGKRTQEAWQERVEKELKILEERTR